MTTTVPNHKIERVTRVLFFAYHFPPVGGGSVQRSARFARLLPEYGYEPVVLAGPGRVRSRWMPEDETLADDIPRGMEVHRTEGPEPLPAVGKVATLNRLLRRPEAWTRWWWSSARELGAKVAPTTELLYVQMQPYDSAEPGAWLSSVSGKPWVADLLDPWALDEMMVYPTGLHRRRELARMRSQLATASAVVMNTPEAVRRVREHVPELDETPVVSISNGFDPRDFEGEPPRRDDGKFRIVHTGYLHTELGSQMRNRDAIRRIAGGAVPGLDIYTRSHVFLLGAVQRLLADDPSMADTLEVHLAGVLTDLDREIAAQSPVVRLHGYVDHEQTVALQRSADLLFLPMQNLPEGTRATIVPGKTWEYLASGRPILAAVPHGDARDVLLAAGTAHVARPDDVPHMAELIAGELRRKAEHRPERGLNRELIARYAYPELTRDLASVFDAVVGRPRNVATSTVAIA